MSKRITIYFPTRNSGGAAQMKTAQVKLDNLTEEAKIELIRRGLQSLLFDHLVTRPKANAGKQLAELLSTRTKTKKPRVKKPVPTVPPEGYTIE